MKSLIFSFPHIILLGYQDSLEECILMTYYQGQCMKTNDSEKNNETLVSKNELRVVHNYHAE